MLVLLACSFLLLSSSLTLANHKILFDQLSAAGEEAWDRVIGDAMPSSLEVRIKLN